MKQADVVLGQTYVVKVSGHLAPVTLESVSPYGGWNGRNTRTGREVRIRSAAKLRRVASVSVDTLATPVARVTLICNECQHTWRVSPNAVGAQCANCNSVDFKVKTS